jgi:hypothetical protein
MSIIQFPQKQPTEPPFLSDIREDGYHIYNIANAKKPDFYPSELPEYPGVALKDLREDDIITIRVFFGMGSGKNMRVDGGYVDLKVEFVDENKVLAVITTKLPNEFALNKGESIEIFQEEILYKADSK